MQIKVFHCYRRKKSIIKGSTQSLPRFYLHPGTRLVKSLEIRTKKYLITKRNTEADCRMVFETRRQSMARMEHGLQNITRKMEDKMAAGAFGRATNYG